MYKIRSHYLGLALFFGIMFCSYSSLSFSVENDHNMSTSQLIARGGHGGGGGGGHHGGGGGHWGGHHGGNWGHGGRHWDGDRDFFFYGGGYPDYYYYGYPYDNYYYQTPENTYFDYEYYYPYE